MATSTEATPNAEGASTQPRRSLGGGALADPNFRTYFISAAISQCGSWLLRTTQAWLVLDLTGSPAALGLVTVLQNLPITIFTLFAGVLLDRVPTRRLMIGVQVVFLLQSFALAVLVLSGRVEYWHVLVLATVLGLAGAVDFPSRSAIVSELLDSNRVGNGIALNSALNSGARIIGPGIGGVMIALWGSGVCFAVVSVAYAFATVGLLMLDPSRIRPRRFAQRRSVFGQLKEGLRYSVSTPTLMVNMLLAGFYGTFAYNWALVLPLFARYALNSDAEGFGALNMAMGIGSTIGAFVLATRLGASMRLLLVAAAVFGGSMLILAHTPTLPLTLVMLVLVGILSVLFNATNNTLIQVEADERLRGRVLALYMFLMVGSTPIGSTVTGFVSDAFDVRVALQVNALICLGGLGFTLIIARWAKSRQTAPAHAIETTDY